jgi:hypothetical protein
VRSRLVSTAITLPVLAAVSILPSVTFATPAHAGCSNHPVSNPDNGVDVVNRNATIRVGPHASCGPVVNVTNGVGVALHCFVTNESGNTWSHVAVAGRPDLSGWIDDASLDDNGSVHRCT